MHARPLNSRLIHARALVVLLSAVVIGLPLTCIAAPVQLHNLATGLNSPTGVPDPQWDVTIAPTGAVPRDARTISKYNSGGAAWPNFGPGSQWISPTDNPAVTSGNSQIPKGTYWLNIAFDLVKTGPELFIIDGSFATGWTIVVTSHLNGNEIVDCCPGVDPTSPVNSSLLSSSTPLFINDQSLFVNGTNTLRFAVTNGNPIPPGNSQFGFGFLGGVFAVPIPPSLVLMASALAPILLRIRRIRTPIDRSG